MSKGAIACAFASACDSIAIVLDVPAAPSPWGLANPRAIRGKMAAMWLRFARRTLTTAANKGIIVLEGKVKEGPKTLSIPGSQVRPVFYDLVFESYRAVPGGRGRFAWLVDRADLQIVPFVLEDEAGRIWINPERDHAIVKGGWIERGALGRNAVGRYHARVIAPGDTVRVRGEVYEPRRAPVNRGLRATKERPLEILFRARGEPPPQGAGEAGDGPRKRQAG